jgi:Tol biopolymer transport system component
MPKSVSRTDVVLAAILSAAVLPILAGCRRGDDAPAGRGRSLEREERQVTRVSVSSSGDEADAWSVDPSISADGRFVTFWSAARNLVPGDTNGRLDIFIHDRETGLTERVSVSSAGDRADGLSGYPTPVSADGRFVAFASEAANLVPGDMNGKCDVFVRDRRTDRTEKASVSSSGGEADGRSELPAISTDGRFVTFRSLAANLVPGDTNRKLDIFLHDRETGLTERVSVSSSGDQVNGSSGGSSISADGRFVAFACDAQSLSPDDEYVHMDIFVRDREMGKTERLSVSSSGGEPDSSGGAPSITPDGRFVAFESRAANLVPGDTNRECDIFVHDRRTGKTERVSVGSSGAEANGDSWDPSFSHSISADGRFVAFGSKATNLVPGDTNGHEDVFVHDRKTGTTVRVSTSASGGQADGPSGGVTISSDGRFMAFSSAATNLVPGDTNNASDVFIARNPLVP